MHEAAIASAILERVQQRLASIGPGSRADRVVVRVGEFRNVCPESLSFAFDSLKAAFAGCERCLLATDLVLAEAFCRDGGHRYRPLADSAFRCGACGSGMGALLAGEELDIAGMTVSMVDTREDKAHARTH